MSSKSSGFTLIEVLVAFVILSVSVGALLVAFSGGLRNTSLSRDYTQAVIIAESRLAESGFTDSPTEEALLEGVDGKFQWSKKFSPLDQEAVGNWQLFHVNVKVAWQTYTGQRHIELNSLRWGSLRE